MQYMHIGLSDFKLNHIINIFGVYSVIKYQIIYIGIKFKNNGAKTKLYRDKQTILE